MQNKINVNFDASKLNKTLMAGGKFVSIDIIPLKEAKAKTKQDGTTIQGEGWVLMKTHFVVQSNKDREVKMPIIGEGVVFQKTETPIVDAPKEETPEEEINEESIPF